MTEQNCEQFSSYIVRSTSKLFLSQLENFSIQVNPSGYNYIVKAVKIVNFSSSLINQTLETFSVIGSKHDQCIMLDTCKHDQSSFIVPLESLK